MHKFSVNQIHQDYKLMYSRKKEGEKSNMQEIP